VEMRGGSPNDIKRMQICMKEARLFLKNEFGEGVNKLLITRASLLLLLLLR